MLSVLSHLLRIPTFLHWKPILNGVYEHHWWSFGRFCFKHDTQTLCMASNFLYSTFLKQHPSGGTPYSLLFRIHLSEIEKFVSFFFFSLFMHTCQWCWYCWIPVDWLFSTIKCNISIQMNGQKSPQKLKPHTQYQYHRFERRSSQPSLPNYITMVCFQTLSMDE